MDYKFIMFCIIVFLSLSFLTYIEHRIKSKSRNKNKRSIAVRKRINKDKEKEAAINYITRFRLEYDKDTHMYTRVEKLRPDEIELIKRKE